MKVKDLDAGNREGEGSPRLAKKNWHAHVSMRCIRVYTTLADAAFEAVRARDYTWLHAHGCEP